MENTTVAKIIINDKPVFVKCDWQKTENDLFTIQIYNEDGVWKGRYSQEFARKYMENFDGTEEEYYKSVKNALTGDDESFLYEFCPILGGSANVNQFIWKKSSEHICGKVPVHHIDDISMLPLIDYLLEENKTLKSVLTVFRAKHEELANDLENCHKCLEHYAVMKNDLESNLYGKFLQLLNAKKRRIGILEGCIKNGTMLEFQSNEDVD